jgi:hypothetical protein
MTALDTRRPLEDMIGELVEAISGLSASSSHMGLRASGFELDLPIETVVTAGPNGSVVRADMPRTRTRSFFDRPVGRMRLTIDSVPLEVLP